MPKFHYLFEMYCVYYILISNTVFKFKIKNMLCYVIYLSAKHTVVIRQIGHLNYSTF